MSTYQFGKLAIDPKTNPAVLDTLTWDEDTVTRDIQAKRMTIDEHADASYHGAEYRVGSFDDAQKVIIAVGEAESPFPDAPILTEGAGAKVGRRVYPMTDANLHAYVTKIHPRKGPRALGAVPRLGIGVRQSTTLWPGIWKAMNRGDFSANAIQNSVRELHILERLKEGKPPRVNHLFSFGAVQEGHAGSTFEGLWTAGVASALSSEYYPRYGADADHLQVKRGSEGIERTKEFIRASRYYTFYTLDVSDILDYEALTLFSAGEALSLLEETIPDVNLRKDILFYHRQRKVIGKQVYDFDEATIARLVGKYWKALDAVEELDKYIQELKGGEAFDLELSIDENPPEVTTFESITMNGELLFLMEEINRRGIGVTHIAPNFGVEKCTDYRGTDGLEGLGRRVAEQSLMASEYGFMLDCHSGDDLSRKTRQVIGKAAKGRIHYKVSPSLQVLYAQVLSQVDPEKFLLWWQETYDLARESARGGSSVARDALFRYQQFENPEPSADHFFFQEYNFAAVGRRDANGQFVNRERFYDVSDEFQQLLTQRLEAHLCSWAADLFDH